MTSLPGEVAARRLVARFTKAQRWVHWSTAALMIVCIVTALVLYLPALSQLVGRRRLVELVHVYAGFGLPVPMILGWLSRAYRDDLRRLNRFSSDDWSWLFSRDRRSGRIPVGKFNAGQKVNASFQAGSILVMLGTGFMLWYPKPWPDTYRTGATFVHDWLSLAIFIVVIGHLYYAVRERDSLSSMVSGSVPRSYAAREHPAWLAEQDSEQDDAQAADTRGTRTASSS